MNRYLFSEKVYKLSETETLTLTDTWDADVQRVWIKALIKFTKKKLINSNFLKKM